MKRVFIVHGWGGNPNKEWMPWLKTKIENAGYEVHVPAMPDADTPEIGPWVSHLTQVVGTPDKDTYFVGHSIGCQTILRYLETIHTPVGGALFVAGWFNLENLEDEESEKIAVPWINTPIDIRKIKKILPKSILLISKDDPYGAFQENIDKFSQFVTHSSVFDHAGHFTEHEDPHILEQFKNL
jgi:hypothetical protein